MKFRGFGILVFVFSTESVFAQWGATVASGYGVIHSKPLRLGVTKTLDTSWQQDGAWPASLSIEASVYHLEGRGRLGSRARLQAVALAPVVRWMRKNPCRGMHPYLEVGIGGAWVSRKQFGQRELGMHFQFEDRLGFGLRFGRDLNYDLGYKVVHFSNAFLGASNHGLNLHLVSLTYWFS